MTVEQEIVVELHEIRAEVKHMRTELQHLTERFDEALAHRDELYQLQHAEHEKRISKLEVKATANERKLIAYTAVIAAAVLVAGLAVRVL